MANSIGKFMETHLKGKRIEMYIGDQAEWVNYSDASVMSYAVIVGIFKAYDEKSGVITFVSDDGKIFYMVESKVGVFWESGSGFNIVDATQPTIKGGKQWLKKPRDIM